MSKKQSTSAFILETTAPIFNRKGYVGTSLTDLTDATKLTKGAIYCNFKNKEDLAVQAFQYNVNRFINPLNEIVKAESSSIDQLKALCDYYRGYYKQTKEIGGCPILNVGTDAKYINPELFNAARKVSKKLLMNLVLIIQNGINKGEITKEINAKNYANNFFSMLEGGLFMSFTHDSESYLKQIIVQIVAQP